MIVIALIAVAHQAVAVPAGETLRVELKDVSTTGYRWQARDFNPALVSLEGSTVAPGDAPGGSGTRSFEFRARAPGRTTIRFTLSRPWEQNVQPLKEAEVELTVQ